MDKETYMHTERTRAFIGNWGSTSGPLDKFWLPTIGWREGESGYTPCWLEDVPSELADRGLCFITDPFLDRSNIPFYRLVQSWECGTSCPWCEGRGEMSRDEDDPDAESDECPLCEGGGELSDSDVVVCLVPNVPTIKDIKARLSFVPETYDDGEPMDVRLLLWEDGRWTVNWGDVGGDLEHAPVCIIVEPGESAHNVHWGLLEALEEHLAELQEEYDAQAA